MFDVKAALCKNSTFRASLGLLWVFAVIRGFSVSVFACKSATFFLGLAVFVVVSVVLFASV